MDCEFKTIQGSWDVQRWLSKKSAVPLLGVVPSVFKFAFSGAELALGLAGVAVFSMPALATCMLTGSDNACANFCHSGLAQSAAHVGLGAISLGYSLANMGTCGLAATFVEDCCK